MTQRIYNTLSRKREDFVPVTPGQVGMYLCGPTVYKQSHIGHMVGPVIFDTIKRYLTYSGYKVTWVVNITDVDDKLINRANERGMSVDALAEEMTQDYIGALKEIGVDSIDLFPKATEHINEMLAMITKLIADGYAYPLDGDVYFNVEKDDDYGKLSGRSIKEVLAGTRVEANDRKKNPADFALWKGSKAGEPAWDSPWGPGRPGWHIECSAMSSKYLGETFDIHGGGLDLLFPHHENELAQSESCSGKPFANYWLHNGLMQASDQPGKVGGQHDKHGDKAASTPDAAPDQAAQMANKMAGSDGAASVRIWYEEFGAETIRFFLLATHYRSPIDFGRDRISEVGRSIEGFYRLIETFERVSGQDFYTLPTAATRANTASLGSEPADLVAELTDLRNRFYDSMDDDFNTGGALGLLFDMRKVINGFVTSAKLDGDGRSNDSAMASFVAAMTLFKELAGILGVFRERRETASAGDDELVGGLMELMISLRAALRKEKNFALADQIRNGLTSLKVTLEDRPDGTIWRREA